MGTKEQELYRSIEMLKDISGITDNEKLMYTLYFLCDSAYGNEEIRTMANMLKAKDWLES